MYRRTRREVTKDLSRQGYLDHETLVYKYKTEIRFDYRDLWIDR